MKNKDFKVAVGKDTPGMMQCGGCSRPILDRFLLNVLDRAWHIQCVQCSECGITLTEKCFSRDGQLFCKNDFFRRFGTKCAGCSLGISPSDLVRRARNKVFHLKCFTCMMCRKELSTGEELYILDENKFICKEDYISSKLSGKPFNPFLNQNIKFFLQSKTLICFYIVSSYKYQRVKTKIADLNRG